MSEETKQEAVTPTEPNGEVNPEQTTEFNAEEMMHRLEQLESTNKRILEESKSYKDKYRSLRTEVEGKEKQKLEESENWKELLDMEKNRSHELSEKINTFKKTALRKELESQVARRAGDAYDVDDVIRSLPKDLLEIDEESLSIKGIDEAVTAVRDHKSHLFKREKVSGQTASRPEGHDGTKKKTKDDLNKEFRDDLSKFIFN